MRPIHSFPPSEPVRIVPLPEGGAADVPAGGPRFLAVTGARRVSSELGDVLDRVNAREPLPFRFDYTYDAPGHPYGWICRTDQPSYMRYGIPGVSISRANHADYHQVTDEVQYIDFSPPLPAWPIW